ncbi:hypothetical protein BJ741DRAFT_140911 [Chytriomyces cf. hyalinus JEL632]|nr:hypothetical protein BJ741DRAFT_140911 [Chytriomyces cf. hyalinus JEL632]
MLMHQGCLSFLQSQILVSMTVSRLLHAHQKNAPIRKGYGRFNQLFVYFASATMVEHVKFRSVGIISSELIVNFHQGTRGCSKYQG